MKDVLNNLRKSDRLNALGVDHAYSGFKDHTYMVTSHKSNFIRKADTLEALQKRQKYGVAQKAFFTEIENAEKTLLQQYYATRPQLKAAYENTMKQKAESRRGLYNLRKLKVRNAEKLAAQKKKERAQKLEDNQKGLVVNKKGEVQVKDQKNTQARKIAMEIRRVAGERKTIALMHAQMVAKGQHRANPKLQLANQREKAGPLGTPTRDALEEKLAKQRDKRAKDLKKWRERRTKSRVAKKRVVPEQTISAESSQDQVVKLAFMEEVTAAPPSQFREIAANKLKAQREAEQDGKDKQAGSKVKKAGVATKIEGVKPKKVLSSAQLRNQAKQKRQVKAIEAKLQEKKLKYGKVKGDKSKGMKKAAVKKAGTTKKDVVKKGDKKEETTTTKEDKTEAKKEAQSA